MTIEVLEQEQQTGHLEAKLELHQEELHQQELALRELEKEGLLQMLHRRQLILPSPTRRQPTGLLLVQWRPDVRQSYLKWKVPRATCRRFRNRKTR